MPTFKLDGTTIPFEPGDTIIRAAWRQGIEIPHYCWHPGLSAPANCRMCLVEIKPKPGQRPVMLDVLDWDDKANDYKPRQKPKLQPACYVAAADGMEVLGDTSEHARKSRRDVQEFLLLNHPVDCPICDQSGECKLQDYWLEYGQYQKRMRDEPVHKPKGVIFGPTIVYDAERCVMCTRCIRFMDEVAKDPVLDMRERGNLNEITVAPGRQLDGHYTFMTEHVCPVGALTTKDFRFKARVWFLRTAPAVCQGCATGCNAHLDFDPRYNRAYRYRPRDNESVNKYWMCDEGMLTYKEAHDGRVLEARVRGVATSTHKALDEIKTIFAGVAPASIAVVLSAQHSLEDNWALHELGTVLLGTKNVYATGRPEGYQDDILIHRDKNPNTTGVRLLAPGAKPMRSLLDDVAASRVTHVIALGGSAPVDPAALGAATMVSFAAHDGPLARLAAVLLPATSWAEQTGTYVNAKGIRQVSEKALEPQGISKPAWRSIADVAAALGYEPSWTKLRQVRAKLLGATEGAESLQSGPSAASAE
ncbi:MAG TPA: 2Fe-2S iron-sulfur cluster-binding protein [Polyangiaceae bacterium]|jgi:NADH-quinone oxidoreductase subunit G